MTIPNDQPQNYKEFWPYYLREHADKTSRYLHYIGTVLSLIAVTAAVAITPWALIAAPFAGYSFAWVGHFFFEKNKPATFKYPLWSLFSDYRMFFNAISGQIRKHFVAAELPESSYK